MVVLMWLHYLHCNAISNYINVVLYTFTIVVNYINVQYKLHVLIFILIIYIVEY